MEGADVAIVYLDEEDAQNTKKEVETIGQKCLKIQADLATVEATTIIDKVIQEFGKLNILVNNVAAQFPQKDFLKITKAQLVKHSQQIYLLIFIYNKQRFRIYIKEM